MFSALFSPPPSPPRSPRGSVSMEKKLSSRQRHRHHNQPSLDLGRVVSSLLSPSFSSARNQKRAIRSTIVWATVVLMVWMLGYKELLVRRSMSLAFEGDVHASLDLPARGYPMSRAFHRSDEALSWSTIIARDPVTPLLPSPRPRSHTHVTSPSPSRAIVSQSASTPLSPSQELVSLVHFLISNPHHNLPHVESYSPATEPLKTEWILDFDLGPQGSQRDAVWAAFESEVWEGEGKLVVIGKAGDVWEKEILNLLVGENKVQRGEVAVIDLEGRSDAQTLQPVLGRLLASFGALPKVLLGGVPIGGLQELKSLHESGKLKPMLERAGVFFQAPPKKRILLKKVAVKN